MEEGKALDHVAGGYCTISDISEDEYQIERGGTGDKGKGKGRATFGPLGPWLVSEFMTLEPGDVITAGTPPGVGLGMKPPMHLKAIPLHTSCAD